MKTEQFSNALGEIDVKYVDEVINYKAKKKRHWMRWTAIAAACIALVVLFVNMVPLMNHKDGGFPFVIIAYAAEGDTVIRNSMQEGSSVPISLFETENGLKGFVFSYSKEEPGQVSSISVMTEGEFPGVIEEIVGLELESDKHYTIYIPEQGKEFPYSFMLPYTDEAANKVIFCYILVEETDGGYSAVIERTEEFERTFRE